MTTDKFLIIRFSSIGDIVLTSPIPKLLVAHYQNMDQKQVEVHVLTKEKFAHLYQYNPNVSKIFKLEKQLGPIIKALKTEGYFGIIDLHKNLRSFRIRLALFGVKHYSSFDKLNFKKWLQVKTKVNRLPSIHIVDRYKQSLRWLIPEIERQKSPLEFHLENKAYNLQQWSLKPREYICFAIGGTHATKRLEATQIQYICDQINYPIVLLGGPDDQRQAEHIERQSNAKISNLVGALSLMESAAVLKEAKVLITHDTGLMHIAAAFGIKTVSIWGNTIPDFGMYPYQEATNYSIHERDLSCRPCSKIGFGSCPKGHFRCMRDQNLDAIVKKCTQFYLEQ